MYKNRFFFTLLITLVFSHSASAISGPGITFEPIIGYERVQKLVPAPTMSSRLTYGGRIIAGLSIISAEAEYTHGAESQSVGATTYDSMGDRVKLGARSGVQFSIFTASLRAGAQAAWETSSTTVSGAKSTTTAGPSYAPYGGAELRAHLYGKFSASAGAVLVFRDWNNLANTEIQTTAGFSIRLP